MIQWPRSESKVLQTLTRRTESLLHHSKKRPVMNWIEESNFFMKKPNDLRTIIKGFFKLKKIYKTFFSVTRSRIFILCNNTSIVPQISSRFMELVWHCCELVWTFDRTQHLYVTVLNTVHSLWNKSIRE